MYNKSFLFLLILHCSGLLIGMENQIISTPEWSLEKIFEGSEWVSSVCIDPTEKLLGIVFCDRRVHIADFETGKKIAFSDLSHGITSLCFNHDGKKLAVLSHKPETCIFNLTKDEKKLTLNQIDSFAHTGAITSINFDKCDNLYGVESTEHDHTVRIINLKTGQKISSFDHNNWVIVTAVSPSKKFLATGSGNSKARLFDMKQKKEFPSFELQSSVSALTFDPFEKLLAVASRDNVVKIFDLATYKEVACLQHDKLILSMDFAASGNTFVTGSFDGKIRIFSKKEILT